MLHVNLCNRNSINEYYYTNKKIGIPLVNFYVPVSALIFSLGVTLDGGKRYTQTVERSFHISMAALEPPVSEGIIKENVYLSM